MTIRLAALLLAGVSSVAEAQPEPEHTRGAGLRVDLEVSSVIRVTSSTQPVTSVNEARGHVSASWGFPHLRYYAALDLAVGVTVEDLGLAFDAQLLPIGLGVQLRRPERTAFVGVASGIGVRGAPSALPTAAVVPLQLVSVVRLSDKLNLIVRGRVGWFLNRTARDDGAPSATFVDEVDGMAAVQLSRFHYLEGYYLGPAYRELQGARFLGIVFGSGGGEEVTQE